LIAAGAQPEDGRLAVINSRQLENPNVSAALLLNY